MDNFGSKSQKSPSVQTPVQIQ